MRSILRQGLMAGEACANGWPSLPSGYRAEVTARCGWDSLTVDLQHGVQDDMSMVGSDAALATQAAQDCLSSLRGEAGTP